MNDILNELHTLRMFALNVKRQADQQQLWGIAVQCAIICDEATRAIEHYNRHADNVTPPAPRP
jgi:hypothetical protein